MSSLWALGDVPDALERLRADLESGARAARYGDLSERDELDRGYRLITKR